MVSLSKVFDLATVIVLGVMLADLVVHKDGTKVLVDGLTSIWSSSMSALNPGN